MSAPHAAGVAALYMQNNPVRLRNNACNSYFVACVKADSLLCLPSCVHKVVVGDVVAAAAAAAAAAAVVVCIVTNADKDCIGYSLHMSKDIQLWEIYLIVAHPLSSPGCIHSTATPQAQKGSIANRQFNSAAQVAAACHEPVW